MKRRSSDPIRPAWVAVLAGFLLTAPARGQCVPEIVGSVETVGIRDIDVVGTHAYAVSGGFGLRVFDVSDATNPTIVGSVELEDARGVGVAGTIAYIAQGSALSVIDVSVPANPTIIGSVNVDCTAHDVAISGDFAYVGGSFAFDSGRLVVVDVSDPMNPLLRGFVNSVGQGSYDDVAVADGVAYVVGDEYPLVAFDVSDPENPALIAEVGEIGDFFSTGLDVSEDMVFVSGVSTEARMWVIDVSDPKNPTIIGSVEMSSIIAYDVAVSGGEAYVADLDAGLQIVDVSVPSSPTILGSVVTPSNAFAVAVSGSAAYVGAGDFHVVDASTCDRGACCLTKGCLELTAATCATVLGTYLGEASTCVTDACPLPCRADLDESGAVGFADILEVLSDWGPCP